MTLRDDDHTRMELGTIHIDGDMSNHDQVRRGIGSIMRSRSKNQTIDWQVLFGLFPEAGFEYFYGDSFHLVESDVGAGS